MNHSKKILLIIVVVLLLPLLAGLQAKIDPERAQFQPGRQGGLVTQVNNSPVALPGQFMVGALIGFREVVAGLLWVRCDDFFHNGNYDAVVPLIRMITWLDPHQIDVYCTGGWHLGYNFTDSNQRADYRYLPSAIALLKEGVINNPGSSDIEQDLAFVLYQQKALDFKNVIYWMKRAAEEKSAQFSSSRLLAHAYERNGQYDECEKQWRKCIAEGKGLMDANPNDYGAKQHYLVSVQNLDTFLATRAMRADLNKRQKDLGFEVTFKKLGSRVIDIRGKVNLPKGSRVRVELYDEDYKPTELKAFGWDIDQTRTLLVENGVHGMYVDKGEFHRKYDFSKDLKQYPFAKDRYILKVSVDPRDHAEDATLNVLGLMGEGLAEQKYLDKSDPTDHKLVKMFRLQRKDII